MLEIKHAEGWKRGDSYFARWSYLHFVGFNGYQAFLVGFNRIICFLIPIGSVCPSLKLLTAVVVKVTAATLMSAVSW